MTTYDPQACVVVYSIDDKKSFSTACDILHYLSSQQSGHKIAKLLVSNKVDLERSRLVSLQGMYDMIKAGKLSKSSSDGKDMAMAFDSKFIDTSCVLKHNVDELLVGLTKQILLRQAQDIVGSREKV